MKGRTFLAVLIASLSLASVAAAHARPLTMRAAKAAIVRWGHFGAGSRAVDCRRLSRMRIRCNLVEGGWSPWGSGPSWQGELDGIYAVRTERGRVRVWSPYWR